MVERLMDLLSKVSIGMAAGSPINWGVPVLTYKFAYVRWPELRCSSFKGYTLPLNLKITPLKKETSSEPKLQFGWFEMICFPVPFFWASWMLGRESIDHDS